MEDNPDFLRKKYGFHTSKEVERAAKRTEIRTGNKLSLASDEDNNARIQNYLDRLNDIINPPNLQAHPDFDRKKRNLALLKSDLYNEFVIRPKEIPEAYFESIKRRHREQGHGEIEIPEDYRQELTKNIINDQKNSLESWVDYLTSDEAKYPDWLKYYAFRSILHMGRYDKERKQFTERYGGTVNPFPDLDREALAIVLGDSENYENLDKNLEFTKRFDIADTDKQHYRQFLKNKNFAKLYALTIEAYKPIQKELLKITKGKWIKYQRGSDPEPLVQSIVNYGTGWCLRGKAIAERYLVRDKNDLHVYYSFDKNGKPTIPRVVMVVNQNNDLAEVRGIAKEENLDSYIGEVVDEKLSEPEFTEKGLSYKKKSADMKFLTAIDDKVKKGQELHKNELIFLYEINSPIEGFGYQKDPRIKELRYSRNIKEDASIVFDCQPHEIAWRKEDIQKDTKAYLGSLAHKDAQGKIIPIFNLIQQYNIAHIYTSFPEGRIVRERLMIGGKNVRELKHKLKNQENIIHISDDAAFMLDSDEFTTFTEPEPIDLIRLKIKDLDFTQAVTTANLYQYVQELGLEEVPAEVAPHYRLAHMDQPHGDWIFIGMKPISSPRGTPNVFSVVRRGGERWLDYGWARSDRGWDPDYEFLFRLPKF